MAVRIAGVNIPNKHARVALTAIYGIGPKRAALICEAAGLSPSTRIEEFAEPELEKIRNLVAEYTIEGDLRREITTNIKRKMDLACYQGIRHRRGLPVRGQNTKNNSRTRKGKRKPVRQ